MHPFQKTAVSFQTKHQPKLRKGTAIFAILVFVLSQYARQISYFECRLANAMTPVSLQCDCGKILAQDDDSPGDTPIKNHRHIHADEYFFSHVTAAADHILPIPALNFSLYRGMESSGEPRSHFHPPPFC